MLQIMVVNSKGGCGKTTLATNLASYYALNQLSTVLIDHDPQASSMQWLQARQPDMGKIYGINACKNNMNITRSWALRIPSGTQRVIIDTPAGLPKTQLKELLMKVDYILIPVLPSPIDIRALGDFMKEIYFAHTVKKDCQTKIAVIANRTRSNTLVFRSLRKFLDQLHIPFITTLRDTQNYVKVAENGIGIHELNTRWVERDCEQWQPLINWLEKDAKTKQPLVTSIITSNSQ